MNKIVEGMKRAVRFAKGDTAGARVTNYPKVEDGCGCIWCDVGNKHKAGYHETARGSFRCTRQK